MKRFFYAALGAVVLGVITFTIASAISQYQVRVLLYSPDRANVFIDAFLVAWPVTILAGALLGYRLSKTKP